MTGRGHAVVVGAGIAGLGAARVLADHYERVTIVERDRLLEGPEPRVGVPQARHVHVLALDGVALLERLLPGLQADVAAACAVEVDWTSEVWLFNFGTWKVHPASGYRSRLTSRAILEWSIRRRVAALPNVDIVDQADVTGLVMVPAGGRVGGVTIRGRGAAAGSPRTIPADLVVDAAGRESKGAAWLEAAGVPRPRETRVDAHLGYATRIYRRPPRPPGSWKALIVSSVPHATRGGVLMPLDDERWVLTLAGSADQVPPTEEAAFNAFVRDLPTPLIAEAIADATPLSPITGYRRTENVLRDYAGSAHSVDGFVAIGDAVCALNPVYGQGMTVAAREAVLLDECLRTSTGDEWIGQFRRRLRRAYADPWLLATGEDLRYPTTTGAHASLGVRLLRPYLDRVFMASRRDPATYRTVVEVVHMLKPPRALFHPRVVASVLLGGPGR